MPSRRGLSRRSVANRPGVSRNSIVVGVVLRGLNFADSQSRRGSGMRDAGLPGLALGRVRLDAGQPLKHRALARTREANNADFHLIRP